MTTPADLGKVAVALATAATSLDAPHIEAVVRAYLDDMTVDEVVHVLIRLAGIAGGLAHTLSTIAGADVMPAIGLAVEDDPW